MEKVRNINRERIEVCRNCQGSGITYPVPDFHAHSKGELEPTTCPVCEGSGRITKKLNVSITITPYKEDK